MWGSDFCQTHDRPYAELVALAERAFRTLTPAQRERCFLDTPKQLWPGLR
jgi:predicted TIM-barrel fold metal-dependent hydrolase